VQRVHILIGILTVIVFLGTGLYMRTGFPELYGDREAVRFLFRANHVYILFSGLLNIMAGLLSVPLRHSAALRGAAGLGSIALLLSAPLFITAFFVEPVQASPMRPLTVAAAFLALIGTSLLAVVRKDYWKRTR
jgi:hypothetical protein